MRDESKIRIFKSWTLDHSFVKITNVLESISFLIMGDYDSLVFNIWFQVQLGDAVFGKLSSISCQSSNGPRASRHLPFYVVQVGSLLSGPFSVWYQPACPPALALLPCLKAGYQEPIYQVSCFHPGLTLSFWSQTPSPFHHLCVCLKRSHFKCFCCFPSAPLMCSKNEMSLYMYGIFILTIKRYFSPVTVLSSPAIFNFSAWA